MKTFCLTGLLNIHECSCLCEGNANSSQDAGRNLIVPTDANRCVNCRKIYTCQLHTAYCVSNKWINLKYIKEKAKTGIFNSFRENSKMISIFGEIILP